MAYRFAQDIRQIRSLVAWVDWRITNLHEDNTLLQMIRITAPHHEAYHDLFHDEPEHSMILEAKWFTGTVLNGVISSLVDDVHEHFGCSAPGKVGNMVEAMLYWGLCETRLTSNEHRIARELFFLARDIRKIFTICQGYKFSTCPRYHITNLRDVVTKMENFGVGTHPYR